MANNGSAKKKSGVQLDREIDEVLQMRQKKAAAKTSAPRSSGIPSQSEYEQREISDAQRKLTELRRAPLADRKEAAASFLEAMREHPEIVGERIGWLFDGNYGYGSMALAKRVLASPRMNRAAALTHMIGAFEWMSPEEMSRAAWHKLSASEKVQLERVVQAVINEALAEE